MVSKIIYFKTVKNNTENITSINYRKPLIVSLCLTSDIYITIFNHHNTKLSIPTQQISNLNKRKRLNCFFGTIRLRKLKLIGPF